MWLDPSGKQLLQWPIEEVEALRGRSVTLKGRVIKPGQHLEVTGLQTAQVCVVLAYILQLIPFFTCFSNVLPADGYVQFSKEPKGTAALYSSTGTKADQQIAARCVILDDRCCQCSAPRGHYLAAVYVAHAHFSPHLLPSPPLTSTARAPCHAWSFISNPFRLQVRCAELGTNQTSQLAS